MGVPIYFFVGPLPPPSLFSFSLVRRNAVILNQSRDLDRNTDACCTTDFISYARTRVYVARLRRGRLGLVVTT